jgi:hypothetical protein
MEPDRVDLSALGLTLDRLRYERLVRRTMEAAGPELARRAGPYAPVVLLGGWARPLLAAAAIVAVLAGGVLTAIERTSDAAPPATMVDALGVPSPAGDWLAEGREPTRADLVLAMERRR